MHAVFRWFVSLWVVVSLVACTTEPRTPSVTTTVLPVASADPARLQAVQDAVFPGDEVRVTTHGGQIYVFKVTRVSADTLYGTGPQKAFEVPLAEVDQLEIHRKVLAGASASPGSSRGGSGHVSGHHSGGGNLGNLGGVGGKGAEALIVVILAVLVLVGTVYTMIYVYKNVQKEADARKPAPSGTPDDLFVPAPTSRPVTAP